MVVGASGRDVLVIDDVCLYREGLAAILGRQPGIGRVRTAPDVDAALRDLPADPPDLVLLSVATSGGPALLRTVRLAVPRARLIAIGVTESDGEVVACAEAGADGYLLRWEPLDHLLRLIHAVAAGETLCSPRFTAVLLRRVAALAAEGRTVSKVPILTAREGEVLSLLDEGLSNREIADRLGIEVRTVKNHVHNLLEKTATRRRGEAVAAFRRLRHASGPSPR